MRDVYVVGVGHTCFGQFLERNIKSLVKEAVTAALNDAKIEKSMLEAAFFRTPCRDLLIRKQLKPQIEVIEIDANLGDPPFAQALVERFEQLMKAEAGDL